MHEADCTVAELWACLATGRPVPPLPGLCSRAGGQVVSGGPRPPVENLDRLPFPYRGRAAGAYRDGHATVSTSRGCAAHCTFCQSGNYGNRYHKLPRWRVPFR